MLKNQFKNKSDFDTYLGEQEARMKMGYLTRSERIVLNKMLEKGYKPEFIKEETPTPNIRPITTNINLLRIPCTAVEKDEDIKQIIIELKETLNKVGGLGLSSNQIGYNKKISYIKIPKIVDKKIEFTELVLINPKIVEHTRKIVVQKEGCLSLPNLRIDTDRWVFITVQFEDETLKQQLMMMQDTESFCTQHEVDHLQGKLIIDKRHRDINHGR